MARVVMGSRVLSATVGPTRMFVRVVDESQEPTLREVEILACAGCGDALVDEDVEGSDCAPSMAAGRVFCGLCCTRRAPRVTP